jgi:hypothetical protein
MEILSEKADYKKTDSVLLCMQVYGDAATRLIHFRGKPMIKTHGFTQSVKPEPIHDRRSWSGCKTAWFVPMYCAYSFAFA